MATPAPEDEEGESEKEVGGRIAGGTAPAELLGAAGRGATFSSSSRSRWRWWCCSGCWWWLLLERIPLGGGTVFVGGEPLKQKRWFLYFSESSKSLALILLLDNFASIQNAVSTHSKFVGQFSLPFRLESACSEKV